MQEREKGLFCDGKSLARYVDCEHQDVELMANTDVSKINLTPTNVQQCTFVEVRFILIKLMHGTSNVKFTDVSISVYWLAR